jgi:hypothetical protein
VSGFQPHKEVRMTFDRTPVADQVTLRDVGNFVTGVSVGFCDQAHDTFEAVANIIPHSSAQLEAQGVVPRLTIDGMKNSEHEMTAADVREAMNRVQASTELAQPEDRDAVRDLQSALLSGKLDRVKSTVETLRDGQNFERIVGEANSGLESATGHKMQLSINDSGNMVLMHKPADGHRGFAMEFTPGDASEAVSERTYLVDSAGPGQFKLNEVMGGALPDNAFLATSDAMVQKIAGLPANVRRYDLVDHAFDGYVR